MSLAPADYDFGNASNYSLFGSHKQSLCEYENEPVMTSTISSPSSTDNAQCFIQYSRLVRRGVRGEDVRQVQICMASLGFEMGPFDGIFGPLTGAGVEAYQIANNLLVDQIVGPQTAGHLNALSGVALDGVTPLN